MEARQQTPEGAVAFVKFYFDQVNKAYMTPDATLIPALSEPDCKSCVATQGEVPELLAQGRHYQGPVTEVSSVVALDGAQVGQQLVSFTMQQLAVNIVDDSGVTVDSQTEASGALKALLTWKGERWSISGVG